MNRRGFMGIILAASVAPAIIRAASLDVIKPMHRLILPGPNSWEHCVREVGQFDILTDTFLWRWDVLGACGTQLHIGARFRTDDVPPHIGGLVAMQGKPIYISGEFGPVSRSIEGARLAALETLRREVDKRSMLVVDGLQLPNGVPNARFL